MSNEFLRDLDGPQDEDNDFILEEPIIELNKKKQEEIYEDSDEDCKLDSIAIRKKSYG